MNTLALTPRQPVPALNIPLVGGGRYVLGATLNRPGFELTPKSWTNLRGVT